MAYARTCQCPTSGQRYDSVLEAREKRVARKREHQRERHTHTQRDAEAAGEHQRTETWRGWQSL